MFIMVLAHQGVRQEGALHRRVRVVRTEQGYIVLYSLGVGPFGKKCAPHGFDAQHGCLPSQAPVDGIGVAREFREGDGLIKGG